MKNISENQLSSIKLLLKNVLGVVVLMTASLAAAFVLPLENVTDYGSRTIPASSYTEISMPAVTANKVVALRFNAHNITPAPAGFGHYLKLELNSTVVPLTIAGTNGAVRLIGRSQAFKLLSNGNTYSTFSGVNIASMFAPSYAVGNAMTEEGLSSTYELIITDMVSSASANSLKIYNLCSSYSMQVDHIEVGYRPDSLTFGSVTIPANSSATINLPVMPTMDGEAVILHLNEHNVASGGCNDNLKLELNNTTITRLMSNGNERLTDKRPEFKLLSNQTTYDLFNGETIASMFASNYVIGNAMTADGLGSTLDLNVSDMIDGNWASILKIYNLSPTYPMQVDNIEIEWRGHKASVADSMTIDGITLGRGAAGGFTVGTAEGGELKVETAIGMSDTISTLPSVLIAADSTPPIAVYSQKVATGYWISAYWPNVIMDRAITIEDGIVHWNEQWTNRTSAPIGLPFRHRFFWNNQLADFRIAGDDIEAVETAPGNPTLFVENAANGNGFGITAESDWLRLLMWMRHDASVGEIYSRTLALDAYSNIVFETTITPVQNNRGYWTFINSVRERWGANGHCMERPLFFGYDQVSEYESPEDRLQQSLGHLGPIYLAKSPWLRLVQDAGVVNNDTYPKLSSPTTPGLCPYLDVATFITFAHRQQSWTNLAAEVALFRSAVPSVKIISLSHPSSEIIYKPCKAQWPWASDGIIAADGSVFEAPVYSNAWLPVYVNYDWGVLYYLPRIGSNYLAYLLAAMQKSMDDCDTDGIYCDEASFAFSRDVISPSNPRGYSRYDYSCWDGYSATLDSNGNIVRFKSDNGYVTEQTQLQLADSVYSRDKFYFCNTAAALRSVNNLHIPRFVEGTNDNSYTSTHLSSVPLVLFDEVFNTRKELFDKVKEVLQNGCIYSPCKSNLLLEGSDNFVCKLYPITIRQLGPGFVKGEERLIANYSGTFSWPGYSAVVRMYVYNSDGDLISDDEVNVTNVTPVSVPSGGLVIAEIIP